MFFLHCQEYVAHGFPQPFFKTHSRYWKTYIIPDQYVLCTKLSFTYIVWCSQQPLDFIFPFFWVSIYKWRNWDSEKWGMFPKILGRKLQTELEYETKITWQKTSMFFPLYKAAVGITGVHASPGSKCHSSSSKWSKCSKIITKSPEY